MSVKRVCRDEQWIQTKPGTVRNKRAEPSRVESGEELSTHIESLKPRDWGCGLWSGIGCAHASYLSSTKEPTLLLLLKEKTNEDSRQRGFTVQNCGG